MYDMKPPSEDNSQSVLQTKYKNRPDTFLLKIQTKIQMHHIKDQCCRKLDLPGKISFLGIPACDFSVLQ